MSNNAYAKCCAILASHRNDALSDLRFHRLTKPRRSNVDAVVASLKISWLDRIIADITKVGEAP